MIIDINPVAGTATVAAVAMIGGFLKQKLWLSIPAGIVMLVTTMVYCESTPEAVAGRKAQAEKAARDAQPHVIREADGCKVYAFSNGGQWHYFTRCGVPGTVTTDRGYTEQVKCGKNCTRNEPRVETIVTKEQQ